VDSLLLAAVQADAADYLVTDDLGIIRKARRINLSPRVLTPAAAIDALNGLSRRLSLPPPAVRQIYAYELDSADPIFDSFRIDYPGFDNWLSKCKREHRLAWIVEDDFGHLAGVCIIKEENSGEHDLQGDLLKLCSFQIADEARGSRYGELLLKAVFTYAFENRYDYAYVEVLPKYNELINLTETFGFVALSSRTKRNELVTAKKLKFSEREYESLDALEFHVRFGPKYVKATDAFVVPIKPKYHDLLFPELAPQTSLFSHTNAYGNSILKAYLCHSPTRQLTPGSVLLFYESERLSQIRCIGVAEETLVSSNVEEIARFVGQRTVYSLDEIKKMCSSSVLAILFRQTLGIGELPFGLEQLVNNNALRSVPQSITRVKRGGLQWIRDQIELSP
jgi:L-amino acid N-acyltransferase YncA